VIVLNTTDCNVLLLLSVFDVRKMEEVASVI